MNRSVFLMTRRWGLCLMGLLALLPALAWSLTLPAGVQRVTEVEGITEYRLESNGFRFLLAPDDSKPSVTVNMTYLVGSRHENYGQTGMAHLLEHMIFKGTPTIRNALAEFSRRGLRANGTTSQDRTNYYATFAANSETLDWYIRWQADAMVNSLIAREDLDSEMTVVRNEMESGENSPFRMLYQKTHAAAYEWHNYGKSIIGARSDVEGVDIKQLQDFYRLYYQPDNAVLTVTGKFDPGSVIKVIADAFGPIPKPARTLPRQYTVEPIQDGERRVTLRRNGGTPIVATVYHVPPGTHEDYPAVELAAIMLSDSPSGRLYQALVPTGLATSVFGFARDMHDPGTVMFGAQVPAGQAMEKTLRVMTETLETMASQPFTEEELSRARSQWLNAWTQTYSDVQRLGTALSEPIALGDWRLFFKQRDRIKRVTLAQTQQAAQTFLLAANRTEGLYVPTDAPVRAPATARPDLNLLLEGYVGDPLANTAQAFDPSPENIERMTQRKVLNLPSGMVNMALLPKSTRGQRVRARIEIRFGDADSLRGKATVSTVTADMLAYGTQTLSRQQINDRVDALNAEMSITGGGTGVAIGLSTIGPNLPALLDLALHVVKEASFPEDQLREYRTRAVTGLRNAMTEPGAIASRTLSRYQNRWPSDDLRYVPTFEEAIARTESISREDLVQFHQAFYGGGQITVAVAGDFDPDAVIRVFTETLGNWKRAPAYKRVSDPYQALKPTLMMVETPDKANAVFIARLPLKLQDNDPDYPALVIANYLLGSSSNSRLWMRIRETDGLSYDVRSRLTASAFEPSAMLSFSGIFAPENWPKFQAAMTEELDSALKQGFTDEEVKSGVESLLNLRRLNRSQDGSIVSAWVDYLQENRTFAWSADFDRKIMALDANAVNAALRKYLDPQALVRAVAGDFAKATRKTP